MAKTSLGKVSVLPKGEYSSVIQYSRLDIVTYKGSSYLCIKDSLGIEITNEEYWQLLAQKGDTGETGATGAKGDKGDAGKDFSIYKTYPSISAMESDASNVPEGEFVLIASDVEDTDNAKLYVKSNTGFVYLTDLSGATGIKGEKGDKPINGIDYNTPEEKEEFKNEVVENATVEVEQNIANIQEQAIQEFNSNASTKTNEYNSNTTTKLQEYNTNANTKIEEYNSNATQKTNTFNGNVTTQIETFNNNATSKTNDFNSNASTKTEEFNAVVDAEKEQFAGQTEAINHHIAVVSDELERVKNDVLETGEESGSYITLNDSAMAEYQELSVDGVCEQETTSGKNFLNVPNEEKTVSLNGSYASLTLYNVNAKLEPNNYVLSYKIKSSTNSLFNKFNLMKEDDTDIVVSNPYKKIGNTYEEISVPFTINEETTIKRIFVQTVDDGSYTFKEIMVSTNGGDYEPYTGGQPSPNTEYPQPISVIENSLKVTSCNKNLFDKDNVIDGYRFGSDGKPFSANGYSISDFIEIVPNELYILQRLPKGGSASYCFYDKNKNFISRTYTYASMILSIRATNETRYIRIAEYTQELNSIMLEKGSNASSYEQHLETQIEANFPEGEFIGKLDENHKDTLEVEYNEEDGEYHLVLNKMIGKKIFDGTEVFNLNSTTSDYIEFFANSTIRDAANSLPTLSNYFLYNINNRIAINNIGIYIRVPILCGIDTVEKFNTFLSSNNVEVYYVLAKPYTIDLGIVDMPITYNEVTNLFTDSDLMPTINAKYYRNFISTVRNLQVNEKSLKQELIDINNRLSALESATTNVASESEVVE